MKVRGLAVCVALGLACVGLSQGESRGQVAAVSFVSSGTSAPSAGQSVGWQFEVLDSITITGLSWFDLGGDGLTFAHTVGVWDGFGTLLGSATIPDGTTANLDSAGFRYVSVAPFTLAAGASYTVGGQDFFGSEDGLEFNVSSQTTAPQISYVGARYSNIGSGFTRPMNFSGATTGFYGPSFEMTPAGAPSSVPEPGPFAMLGCVGLSGAGLLWRRGRK